MDWEIAGVSEEAMRFHSSNTKRREAIVKLWEKDFGRPPTRQELETQLRQTRISKKATALDKEADSKGVWAKWAAGLRAHGIPVPLRTPEPRRARLSELKRRQELHDRLMSTKGLCRDDADFAGDSIMNAIQRSAVGLGFTQDELKAAEADLRQELIVTREANDDRYTYFTTKAQLEKEGRLERGRRHISAMRVPEPKRLLVEQVLQAQAHQLDPKQREAVFAATRSSWVHIEGHAGAGKSSSIGAAREALKQAGLIDETVVISTAAATAQRSGIKIGADRYGSVESIERMVAKGTLKASHRRLWIIDEAAMMDTDRLDRLLMAARGQGRFVFVGDPAQLSPIGPGGWYQESVKEHGSVMLDQTHRFRDHRDVRDYALLRTGDFEKTKTAVENLAMRDRVHVSEDRSDRMLDAFNAYRQFRDRDPKLSADDIRIIVETSNADVDTANRFIQFDQKARGEIKGEGFQVNDDDQGRAWLLHENESVVFLRSYVPSKREEPVRNGTRGRILNIDEGRGRATVELEDQRRIWVKMHEHEKAQPMAPAGAQHANKIQGDEVEVVQVLPGTEQTANANSAYSQLTRAKREAHVYLDRETHGDDPQRALMDSWAKRVEKRTALSRKREREATAERQVPGHEPTAEQRAEESVKKETQRARRQSRDPEPTVEQDRRPREQSEDEGVRAPNTDERDDHQERQHRKGSLRERLTHIRRDRAPEREEGQEIPSTHEFAHIRAARPERDADRGRS